MVVGAKVFLGLILACVVVGTPVAAVTFYGKGKNNESNASTGASSPTPQGSSGAGTGGTPTASSGTNPTTAGASST